MPRVVVADDHPIFLKGLVEVLVAAGFDVVGQAGDGEALLALVKESAPDLAVIDVDMPALDGLAVLRRARDERLACAFIVLSLHDEAATVRAALALGARAYVRKQDAAADVVAAARAILAGQPWSPAAVPVDEPNGLERLTRAELRVVALLGENLTSAQIAERLGLSVRTVQNHRAHVCDKLSLSGSHRLLQLALEQRDRVRALLAAREAADVDPG